MKFMRVLSSFTHVTTTQRRTHPIVSAEHTHIEKYKPAHTRGHTQNELAGVLRVELRVKFIDRYLKADCYNDE